MGICGIKVLAQRSGANNVEKQNGNLFERLRSIVRLGPRKRKQPGAQGRQRRIDKRVSHESALRLESPDDGFNLLLFCQHVA
jgi:hypothetical protein